MGRVLMNAVIRCLFCLICVYLCNGMIQYCGGNIAVKINEITVCVSTLLGISGVAGLMCYSYFLQFTDKNLGDLHRFLTFDSLRCGCYSGRHQSEGR